MSGGFAELYAAREASLRPAGGRGGAGVGDRTPPAPPPTTDDLPGWAARLTPAAQDVLAGKLAEARTGRDPLKVDQADIDLMSDDEKWAYAEQVVAREQELEAQARARLEAQANARAQTELEGQ